MPQESVLLDKIFTYSSHCQYRIENRRRTMKSSAVLVRRLHYTTRYLFIQEPLTTTYLLPKIPNSNEHWALHPSICVCRFMNKRKFQLHSPLPQYHNGIFTSSLAVSIRPKHQRTECGNVTTHLWQCHFINTKMYVCVWMYNTKGDIDAVYFESLQSCWGIYLSGLECIP